MATQGTPVPSTPIDGKVKTVFVPALANPAAPTVTEMTADSVIDISCYLTGDGWALTTGQDSIDDDRECSTQTFQQPGRKTTDNTTVTVIDNTNTEIEADSNKAVEAMQEGATGYFVRRRGKDFDVAFAAGDKVSVFPVKFGEKQPVATEANSVIRSTIPFTVTGPWYVDNATVAAASKG
ncbi:hypothetical protein [Bifidobacterium scaligerum]|uniref:phage tail tube protein n=1 Tax=Bifidobacterium scaligerum TaxID=2052656 RepID=UPI001A9C394B|nr:hypothetical protein [Bifidobacterium scaligerum]